jgi:hypothetical protein
MRGQMFMRHIGKKIMNRKMQFKFFESFDWIFTQAFLPSYSTKPLNAQQKIKINSEKICLHADFISQ